MGSLSLGAPSRETWSARVAEWLMNGVSVIGGGNITPTLGPGWSYLTGADFG